MGYNLSESIGGHKMGGFIPYFEYDEQLNIKSITNYPKKRKTIHYDRVFIDKNKLKGVLDSKQINKTELSMSLFNSPTIIFIILKRGFAMRKQYEKLKNYFKIELGSNEICL